MAGVGINSCFVSDNVLSSVRNLLDGEALNPFNYLDLCLFLENGILHDKMVFTVPVGMDKSPLQALMTDEAISFSIYNNLQSDKEADNEMVSAILPAYLTALEKGGSWGRGLMNLREDRPESGEDSLVVKDFERMNSSERLIGLEKGKLEAEEGVAEQLRPAYEALDNYQTYINTLHQAGFHFNAPAYVGATELFFGLRGTLAAGVPSPIYQELKKQYDQQINSLLIRHGYQPVQIPPFASIVLSRCQSRDDIVPELLKAREEFTAFRNTCADYRRRTQEANTHDDLLKAQSEWTKAAETFARKINTATAEDRFEFKLYNVVKSFNPVSILTSLADWALKTAIEREYLHYANGMTNVWKKLRKSTPEHQLLPQLFKNEYDKGNFLAFRQYMDKMDARYEITKKRAG